VQTCGDAIVEPGEQCDDGNGVSGDGCTDCRVECPPLTGTWVDDLASLTWTIVDDPSGELAGFLYAGGELADVIPFTGTKSDGTVGSAVVLVGLFEGEILSCEMLRAGPGSVVPWGFLSRIRASYCGDGTTDELELCDDGNFVNGDGCTIACTLPECGNRVVEADEECDDGNSRDGDGCSVDCLANVCGNSIIEAGEECDDGNPQDGDGCSRFCEVTECGNNVVETGEECDDGNTSSVDGCSSDCRAECPEVGGTWAYGPDIELRLIEDTPLQFSGALVIGAEAELMLLISGSRQGIFASDQLILDIEGLGIWAFTLASCDAMTSTGGFFEGFDRLSPFVCGNGALQPNEACDDRNFANADGCTLFCEVAECFACAGEPSSCTPENGSVCDDGDPCTTGELCNGGACVGGVFACTADGNPCTEELCDPEAGCVSMPRAGSCDDGDACTVGQTCVSGECVPSGISTACVDEDGCCPVSCGAQEDSDCRVVPALSPMATILLVFALLLVWCP
jgi:cysteine-rich repeat protein